MGQGPGAQPLIQRPGEEGGEQARQHIIHDHAPAAGQALGGIDDTGFPDVEEPEEQEVRHQPCRHRQLFLTEQGYRYLIESRRFDEHHRLSEPAVWKQLLVEAGP